MLQDCLVSQGRAALIPWLRQVLLAACRVKMYQDELEPGISDDPRSPFGSTTTRPTSRSFWFLGTGSSIKDSRRRRSHKLGFQLPTDVGKVFPRLDFLGKQGFCHHHHCRSPGSPTSGHHHIYLVAVKPGPVETRKLKFLLEELEKLEELEELERITAATEDLDSFIQDIVVVCVH